ncbi:hypothetical protein [Bacillus marinisedimentorum]|uniref:hypothetical protein n=1 Tax=Bacillus marinisedimentorum TaxID=1821260 RepID=UPI00147143F3|nr:hypothetical protein [Bacillus marinisedimentorum]
MDSPTKITYVILYYPEAQHQLECNTIAVLQPMVEMDACVVTGFSHFGINMLTSAAGARFPRGGPLPLQSTGA